MLLKTCDYIDRTLSSPVILSAGMAKRNMTVSALWWRQIIFELENSGIIIRESDKTIRDKFGLNIMAVEGDEKLYLELLYPVLTVDNTDEMIPLILADLNNHIIKMMRESFLYSQLLYNIYRYPINSQGNQKITKWNSEMKQFISRTSKFLDELNLLEESIHHEVSIEAIKKMLIKKYDEVFRINDEFRFIIGFSEPVELNACTELINLCLGRKYDNVDIDINFEFPDGFDDWDNID